MVLLLGKIFQKQYKMYYFFDNYVQAKNFMDQNPTSKLCAWGCGELFDQYAVFIPKVNEERRYGQNIPQ